jgi:hypothetical protein
MAGTIVADTLQDGAGNSTAMDNAIYGSAKAWGSYAYSAGAAPTLRYAYNISSVTRSSTGTYVFAFTNSLADANYGVVGTAFNTSGNNDLIASIYAKSASSTTIQITYPSSLGGSGTTSDSGIDFAVFR